MTVVSIREFDKKRSEVTMDEGLRFVLYRAEIAKTGLEEGKEIADGTLHEIMGVILPKRAKLRAMNLLKARDYTELRLREKLSEGGYPEEIIVETMDYLKSFGYIDDMRYATNFISYRIDTKSRLKLEKELASRGVDREVISAAVNECYSDEKHSDEDPEIRQILKLMDRKGIKPGISSYEDRMRFMAQTARRGYSAEKIRRVLDTDL